MILFHTQQVDIIIAHNTRKYRQTRAHAHTLRKKESKKDQENLLYNPCDDYITTTGREGELSYYLKLERHEEL